MLVILLGAIGGFGCARSKFAGTDPTEQARLFVASGVVGTWRLIDYSPREALASVLSAGLRSQPVILRFDGARARSATSAYTFDRAYRVSAPIGDTFKLWIADEQGVEYESWARFDGPNRVVFECKTEPWRGLGTLDRVGP